MPAPPEQVLPFLPCSIRELELLQPLQRSTSFTLLWSRFKAKSCTHPGPGVGRLTAAGSGRIGLEGGQPGRTFPSAALPCLPKRAANCRARQRQAALPASHRRADGSRFPLPSRRRAYLWLSLTGLKASAVLCVDLVVFRLAFVGDGEPRALIWMTDRINSDSFAPIPGA